MSTAKYNRPKVQPKIHTSIRISVDLYNDIIELANIKKLSNNEAITKLLKLGLAAENK